MNNTRGYELEILKNCLKVDILERCTSKEIHEKLALTRDSL
jgi:hypothetical protein